MKRIGSTSVVVLLFAVTAGVLRAQIPPEQIELPPDSLVRVLVSHLDVLQMADAKIVPYIKKQDQPTILAKKQLFADASKQLKVALTKCKSITKDTDLKIRTATRLQLVKADQSLVKVAEMYVQVLQPYSPDEDFIEQAIDKINQYVADLMEARAHWGAPRGL